MGFTPIDGRWIIGRTYSVDRCVPVAAFVEAGYSRRAAARHLGVSDIFAQENAVVARKQRASTGCPPTAHRADDGRP